MNDRPPRLARLLAGILLPPGEREYVLGDMDELFERDSAGVTRSRARMHYWRQTLSLARHRIPRTPVAVPHRRVPDMTILWRDTVLGLRTAWRSRSYSAITILTLALAIGANTLLFSIANPLLVRALPIAKPEGLGWIQTLNAPRMIDRGLVSVPDLIEFRERATCFSSLAGYQVTSSTLSSHQPDPERITTLRGTSNLTDVWGMAPRLGRLFQATDAAPGQPLAAVLSTRFWRERFQTDPRVIGRQFLLDNRPLVVVGVMPAEIELGNLSLIDMWVPMALDPTAPADARTLRVLGRLAPGASLETADTLVSAIANQQATAHPESHKDWRARVVSTRRAASSSSSSLVLLLLSIVVGFVFFIACANLANLVMARLTSRRLELAVRQALGASRWQLIRPLMVEGLLLSLLGGALGVGVAYGGVRIVNAVAYEPYFRALGIDVNVLIFAGLLSVLTPLLVCLWPAMSAGRSATVDTLRDSRTSGGHAVKVRRNVLVAGQVALALSMLVLSALAVKSMMYVRAIDLGVDVARIALFRYELPPDRYATDDARARFAETLSAHLAQGGGVSAAAVVSHLPVFDGEVTRQVEGLVRHSGDSDQPWVSWYSVTPGFFQTAGVPLLAGRAFSGSDRAGTEPLVILNKTAAERYFGGIDQAVGRTVVLAVTGQTSRSVTVAGVAADTRSPMILTTSPQAYVPFAQWPAAEVVALVRSNAPAARMPDMRAVMRGLDAAVPITDLRTLQDKADDEESSDAILYGLFVAFALLALALAASGLYGVISYSVGHRTREIGVRLVLGAQPAGITRMVLVEGLTVTGIGVLAGLLLGLLLAKMAAPVLQGVSPTDPAAFLLVTMVVLSVAVVSILSPAVRAMRMDPARTLRGD